jgi:hypothetical protein
MTYRFLSLVPFSGIDGVMVLCNMQMEVVLVWKVLLALAATVHMDLVVVDIVLLNGRKSKRVVRGQRALHDDELVRERGLGV